MRYVIIRDDDTNAFTPVECLERLYRPLLDQGLPINLATIPAVSRYATMNNGDLEGFLLRDRNSAAPGNVPSVRDSGDLPSSSMQPTTIKSAEVSGKGPTVPIAMNRKLVDYLKSNPGYRIVQHGCHHDYLEFERANKAEIIRRLEIGSKLLQDAGFDPPDAFVAPYDKLSRDALREVAARFRVLSTGWYELRKLPCTWWPHYGFKKLRKCPHWKVGHTLLLSHPGCLLSCNRTYSTMLAGIIHYLQTQKVTVVVTHWWEYFRNGTPDEQLIDFLHETGSYIATHPDLKVISFSDLASGKVELN